MNLSALRTRCAQELGLDNGTDAAPGTEQSLIDAALNEAVLEVLRDTRCYVKETDYTSFDGSSSDYTLDSSILEVVEMYLTSGGTNYMLERLSVQDLVERRRAAAPAGSPTMYYAINGANMIMFYPAPGASDTLKVYHVPVPTALSASSDDPSNAANGGIPTVLHKGILFQAYKLLASYDDDSTSAQGQRYSDWYDAEITKYRKEINRLGGRNARAVVNDKRRRHPYHDNSVYPQGRW